MGADNIVRRWNNGDVAAKIQEQTELGLIDDASPKQPNRSIEDAREISSRALKGLAEDIPNWRLEEDMGLNNQPVTPEEIHGLADFIISAEYID